MGATSSLILSFDTFIISSCLFTPASHPTLFLTFTPVSFLLPLYISYFTSSLALSLPTFMSLLPVHPAELGCGPLALYYPAAVHSQAGVTLGLVLSPSLSPAYLFLLDPWNKAQPDVWLAEAVARCMEIHLRCPISPRGRCAHKVWRDHASPGLWGGERKFPFSFFCTFCSPMHVPNDIQGNVCSFWKKRKLNIFLLFFSSRLFSA